MPPPSSAIEAEPFGRQQQFAVARLGLALWRTGAPTQAPADFAATQIVDQDGAAHRHAWHQEQIDTISRRQPTVRRAR